MTAKTKIVIAGAVVLVGLLAWLGIHREQTEADTGSRAASAREPVAAVVKVTRGTLGSPLTLAGAFKPFQDVDVHAKVAGYIKAIYVDVGTHVAAGQTLAILEVPELQAELAGADASGSPLQGRSKPGAKRFAGSQVDTQRGPCHVRAFEPGIARESRTGGPTGSRRCAGQGFDYSSAGFQRGSGAECG